MKKYTVNIMLDGSYIDNVGVYTNLNAARLDAMAECATHTGAYDCTMVIVADYDYGYWTGDAIYNVYQNDCGNIVDIYDPEDYDYYA